MYRSSNRKISEKTLEINICNDLIEQIRKHNLYRKAYWIGINTRLEKHIGLDVKLEPGRSGTRLLLGLQFKKPKQKVYDHNHNDYYYLFEINDNSANDQHIILWIISALLHSFARGKFIFIGYAFPKFIDHGELHRAAPRFLSRTVFVEARVFPIGILNRLPHEVLVYERSKRIIVRSKEYELSTENILYGDELLDKVLSLREEHLLTIYDLRHKIHHSMLEKFIRELSEKVEDDVIKYIRLKIDKGWQITLESLLI